MMPDSPVEFAVRGVGIIQNVPIAPGGRGEFVVPGQIRQGSSQGVTVRGAPGVEEQSATVRVTSVYGGLPPYTEAKEGKG